MIDVKEVDDLMGGTRQDIFSVFLDVDPTKPEHQGPKRAYRIWLHQAMRQALAGIVGPARGAALRTGRKVLAHVDTAPIRGRGLAIFAAPRFWREYSLPFPLPNCLQYGRADLVPLLWAMSEYKTYAVVAVYLDHAWIAVAHLGRAAVIQDETLELDTRDWRFKAGRSDTYTRRAGVGVGRGAQADTFDARVDEQRRQFWQSVAQAAARALIDLHIDRVILGGPEKAVTTVRELLPEAVRAQVIDTVPLPAYATLAEVQERTLPVALADHHRRESRLVADLLARAEGEGSGVVGREATIRSLMQGEVKTLVIARDLDGDIWRCTQCEYLSTERVRTCPGCGGTVERLPLRQVFPTLARRHGAGIEVIGSPTSSQLTDGVGALLRYRAPQEAAEAAR
jgi:peptide subunit release factor 1 (eRF1)